jgi:5-methylcytosine-specific restriction protein A
MAFGGFEVGKTYNRRRDIHIRFGGQQQGGISTPTSHPVIFAFTGESGTAHGYMDGWTPDGTYRYFGEGQKGDMIWKAGNLAIRDHTANGEDLLLFQTLGRGNLRFLGEFVCAGFQWERGPDRRGQTRNAIVFSLVPAEQTDFQIGSPDSLFSELRREDTSIEQLRKRALDAVPNATSLSPKEARRSYYARSAAVRQYVLRRADGTCESCNRSAPFQMTDGSPYLEPHHIRRLSDGGPDDPRFVGAICPNCHREIHYGANGTALNKMLQEKITQREADLDRSMRT